jgi:hypothetical protein
MQPVQCDNYTIEAGGVVCQRIPALQSMTNKGIIDSSVTEATMEGTGTSSALSDLLPSTTSTTSTTTSTSTSTKSGTYALTLDYTYFFFSTDIVRYDFTKLDSFTLKYHDDEISEIASLNAENAQDLVDFLTRSCPNLKRLCLQPAVFWDEDAIDIMAKYLAADDTSLVSIDIGLCLPTGKGRPFARWGTEERLLRAICDGGKSFVELRLGGFSFQKPGAMDPLAEMIADHRIQSLELWKCFLYLPNVKFFDAIRSTRSLTSLMIDQETLVEFTACDGTPHVMVNEHMEVWRDLVRTFASNRSLKSLAVLSDSMSDVTAMSMVRTLPKLGQLRELYVDLKWPVLSGATTTTKTTSSTARSNMIRLLDDQETILTTLHRHCMELETLVLHTTTTTNNNNAMNHHPEERDFLKKIKYYCDLNACGRRILHSARHIPSGLWPLIFERMNMQTHAHKNDGIFQMLSTGPCLQQQQNNTPRCRPSPHTNKDAKRQRLT